MKPFSLNKTDNIMSRISLSAIKLTRTVVLILLLFCFASPVLPQDNGAKKNTAAGQSKSDEKSEQILQRAIEAMGGRTYLDVRTVIARGYFTQFANGTITLPSSFIDYVVLPDRERTEFRGQGNKIIQTNIGDKGWIYDGAARTLKDMKPEQVEDFRLAVRSGTDNILRGWWRKEGAQLSYVGRREAGLARRNEAVRLTYPDGFTVEFEFSAKDGLPAKALYKRKNAEGEEVAEEDRYAQYLTVSGVIVPFVIDHFRAGVQSSRINYESVEFNRPIPDSLFTKPADIKALK